MTENAALFLFLSVGAAAMFSFIAVTVWAGERRKERETYHRSETIKKIAETGPHGAAIEFLRETERISARRMRGGIRLAGMIVFAAGVGLMIFLQGINPGRNIYLVGMIPLCVGIALFSYAQFLAPRE